jgi:hypothetical protein
MHRRTLALSLALVMAPGSNARAQQAAQPLASEAQAAQSVTSPQLAAPQLGAPVVRVTLQLDSGATARFDARTFDLRVSSPASGATGSGAEIQLVKPAGPHTGDLVRLSASGARSPMAQIEILDSLGVATTTWQLRDVTIASDHVTLASSRVGLEQQRLAQQEALSTLTAEHQEAQRQLATVEELGKSRVGTRLELARARDRSADLERRMALPERRRALVNGQLASLGVLEETVVLRFGRLDIDSAEPGGRATITLGPRAAKR